MDRNTVSPLESIGLLAALWVAAAFAHAKLGPKAPPKVERLCGYHIGSSNRRNSLAVLDSARCEICKQEENNNV